MVLDSPWVKGKNAGSSSSSSSSSSLEASDWIVAALLGGCFLPPTGTADVNLGRRGNSRDCTVGCASSDEEEDELVSEDRGSVRGDRVGGTVSCCRGGVATGRGDSDRRVAV